MQTKTLTVVVGSSLQPDWKRFALNVFFKQISWAVLMAALLYNVSQMLEQTECVQWFHSPRSVSHSVRGVVKDGEQSWKKEDIKLTESEGLGHWGRRDSGVAAPDNGSIERWRNYKDHRVIFRLA